MLKKAFCWKKSSRVDHVFCGVYIGWNVYIYLFKRKKTWLVDSDQTPPWVMDFFHQHIFSFFFEPFPYSIMLNIIYKLYNIKFYRIIGNCIKICFMKIYCKCMISNELWSHRLGWVRHPKMYSLVSNQDSPQDSWKGNRQIPLLFSRT